MSQPVAYVRKIFLLRSYDETAQHMWERHWLQGHDMSMWSEDVVIWKLLTLQPGLSGYWKSTVSVLNSSRPNKLTWQNTDMKTLRLELEARRFDDARLSLMAFNEATNLGANTNDTNLVLPSASAFESVNYTNDANVDGLGPMGLTPQTDTSPFDSFTGTWK